MTRWQRGVGLMATGVVMMMGYQVAARLPGRSVAELTMPNWVPFFPVFAVLYVLVLGVGLVLPLYIRDEARFRRAWAAGIVSYLLVLPCWLLWPTTLLRPPVSLDWWNLGYVWLAACDPPTNILPCAHIIAPVIGAWYLGRERPFFWTWLVPLLLFSALSIAVTWQHRPQDIVIGAGIAGMAIGIVAVFSRFRR